MLSVMPQRILDEAIDRLYQGPLESFTAERNQLARTAGSRAAEIRALQKPPIAAWAVNQLYWRKRKVWEALIAAAQEARRAHQAVLSGRSGDVRATGRVHDEAVDTALKATLELLAEGGHPATEATRQAVLNTLRALPADVPPGRLTATLQPGGLEMLAGLSIAKGTGAAAKAAPRAPAKGARHTDETTADARAAVKARAAAAAAEQARRDAEQEVRRLEFESARAAREEQRAAGELDRAKEALARAEHELQAAEEALHAARSERRTIDARLKDSRKRIESR
jgi:hypothetical protein